MFLPPSAAKPPAGGAAELEAALAALLAQVPDESGGEAAWQRAKEMVRAYALRPAKRVRPRLLFTGYRLAMGDGPLPPGLLQFGASLELLHTFLLIHDDLADRATTRRGGPALHLQLGQGKLGEDLAVVHGDHLFARAVEGMLGSGLPGAAEVTRYLMGICRQTAAGQHLDLALARAPFSELTVFQVLKVALLKTARYGFVAPLVGGATLGGATVGLLEPLERAGRHAGLAFQLADDVLGLFGDDAVAGKSGAGDFYEAKRTFPVIAAHTRADRAGRERLEALWNTPNKGPAELERARAEVDRHGGRAVTLRVIDRATRAARKAVASLPPCAARDDLDALVEQLARRSR